MAKNSKQGVPTKLLVAPAVISLLIWMIVPLSMTLWFSFQYYNLQYPNKGGFVGFENYQYLFEPGFGLWQALLNTCILITSVLIITMVMGSLLAVLFNQKFIGRNIARTLAISPFFVMPTVSALVWKNMLMHPVNGLFAYISKITHLPVIDWFSDFPLLSIILIVSWEWTPFALLILLTSLQSLDMEQYEAAILDGAKPIARFRYIILPHLSKAISTTIMIETIFLLTVFAEILVTTSGGPGMATTNLAFLIYKEALLGFDVGMASAGGVIAIILANIIAFFLIKAIGKNLSNPQGGV
ncbi:MAG: carbohydrate ABC transporter permease [Alphaproteobacteria bacterium]